MHVELTTMKITEEKNAENAESAENSIKMKEGRGLSLDRQKTGIRWTEAREELGGQVPTAIHCAVAWNGEE